MGVVDDVANLLVSGRERVTKYQDRLLEAGIPLDNYLDGPSSTKRSCVELIVYFPIILYAYFWMEQGPYSEYWVLDLPFLAIRYIVLFLMIALLQYSSGSLFITCFYMTVDFGVMWATDLAYWMVQSEADQMCYIDNMLTCTDYWWTVCFVFFVLFIAYIVYASVTIDFLSFADTILIVKYGMLFVTPFLLCAFGLFRWITAPIMYFWTKCLISMLVLARLCQGLYLDNTCSEKRLQVLIRERFQITDPALVQSYNTKINKLQQKIESRKKEGFATQVQDVNNQQSGLLLAKCVLTFGFMFLLLAVNDSLVFKNAQLSQLLTYQFYMEFIAAGSSNCITLVSIAFWFGFIADIILLLLTYGQQIVRPVSLKVQVFVMILCLETNILISDDRTRLYKINAIFFLSIYEVVLHILNHVEAALLGLFNTGRQEYREMLKLWSVLLVITVMPTYMTTIAADTMELSPWLLFHASGNVVLLVKVCFIITECFLLWLPWNLQRWEEGLSRALTYIRIAKNFIVVGEFAIYSYYRLMAPFMSGFFIVRVIFNIGSFGLVAVGLYFIERDKYNARNKCYFLLKDMPDVHFENDSEDCAVCFASLVDGKRLPCGHAFHYECLNKWFKVKTVCPLCNTAVNSGHPQQGPTDAAGQPQQHKGLFRQQNTYNHPAQHVLNQQALRQPIAGPDHYDDESEDVEDSSDDTDSDSDDENDITWATRWANRAK